MEKVKSDFTQTEEERGHPPQQTLTHLTPTHTRTHARGSKREISLVYRNPVALPARRAAIHHWAKPSATPPPPPCWDNGQKAPCDSSLQTAGLCFPTAEQSRATSSKE